MKWCSLVRSFFSIFSEICSEKEHNIRTFAMLIALSALFSACGMGGTPDPRSVDGALAYLAVAMERDEPGMLYRALDVRSRHAMISIVEDRRAAAAAIREHYPPAERETALRALGDAANVESAEALFLERCDAGCRRELAGRLGAAVEQDENGNELRVTTTRGEIRFYRENRSDWWGFVWRQEELDRERDRAAQERRSIERNAAVHQQRSRLQEGPAE